MKTNGRPGSLPLISKLLSHNKTKHFFINLKQDLSNTARRGRYAPHSLEEGYAYE